MTKTAAADMKAAVREWVLRGPLRKHREDNGLTLMEVAGVLGVSISSVQLWENGGHVPEDPNMTKLARLLNQAPETLTKAWTRWLASRPSAPASTGTK